MDRPLFKSVLLLILTCCLFDMYAIGDKHYQIDNRTMLQEGLSQSRVLSIMEDERGFMWFGTADGLNRYDGYSFKIFRNIFNDSTSLPNNTINSMVEDNDGNIWIGTNNGVAVFDPYTETFISLRETDSTAIALGANIISSCVIDKDNNIWYSTRGCGIYKVNPKSQEKKDILFDGNDPLHIKDVANLYIDSYNRLWIGGFIDKTVLAYNINKGKFERYPIGGITDKESKTMKIGSFFEDNDKRIWLNSIDYNVKNGGLFFLDHGKKTFNDYWQFVSGKFLNSYHSSLNAIISLTGDDEGNIWFASLLNGIFKLEFGSEPIAFYNQSPTKDAAINCIYRSNNGILWIGTNGFGIEISISDNTDFKLMNSKTNSDFSITSIRAFAEDDDYYWVGGYYGLSKIKKDFSEAITVQPTSVYSIANCTNDPNLMWTGSEGGGLIQLNKTNNTLLPAEFQSDVVDHYLVNTVFVIHPINDTLLLLGTYKGLVGYNPVSKTISPYPHFCSTSNNQAHKTVRTIYEDRSGNILIGYVQGGIGKLELNKKCVGKFNVIPDLQAFSNYNPINCIYNDKENRYWIATSNGLVMCDTKDGKIKIFTEADGLPNSHVYAILPDDEDNLWLSTNNGLSCYCPREGIFRNYYISDGLQNNEFNTGAYFKASDGTLFFGGIGGFNYFNPKQIKQNSIVPELVITGIRTSNQYLKISKQMHSKKKHTIQPHEETTIIEFAGLSFINSHKNQYKYKIRELNKEWIHIGSQHQIFFNDMSPGIYTLEILASNNHGLWLKKPYVFKIVVLPTFLESAYFKWIVAILTLLLIFAVYKIRLRQITMQKNNLQNFANQQTASLMVANETLKDEMLKHKTTANELNASNKTKDKFLSIMAHDIINPLGVILGFSDLLTDKNNVFEEEEKFSFLQTINLTAKGLSSLLSNLLQWSRLQNNTIIPKPQGIILKNAIQETTKLLHGNIVEKEIDLLMDIDDETKIKADGNMLSTILRNLLSNAIKFTPVKGQIRIGFKHIGKMVEISIADNGVGIPKENLGKLFAADANITTKGTNNESGTGLGLGLVHEFVIMNGGEIWVDSEVSKGSTFYFTLPSTTNS